MSARARNWSSSGMCETASSSDSSAPSQTRASATTTAAAKPVGRQRGTKSMIAGGRPGSNRTLPVRSPWITWLGTSIGLRTAARRLMCAASTKSVAGSSPHATRSPTAQRSVRLSMIAAGRGTAASAAWNLSPTATMSAQRPGSWRPVTRSDATQPSWMKQPSKARRGRATRKPLQRIDAKSAASHSISASPRSAGFRTMAPATHDPPWPPSSGVGAAVAPKASRTERGGAFSARLPRWRRRRRLRRRRRALPSGPGRSRTRAGRGGARTRRPSPRRAREPGRSGSAALHRPA